MPYVTRDSKIIILFFMLFSTCLAQKEDELLNQAVQYYNQNQFQKSLNILEQVIYSANKNDNYELLFIGKTFIGKDYQGMHQFDLALINYNEALSIADSILNNKAFVANICGNLGGLLGDLVLVDESLSYLNRSLKILNDFFPNDKDKLADIYSIFAKTYANNAQYPEALSYYEKCLNIRIELYGEKYKYVAETQYNLATVLLSMNEYEKALSYFNKALSVFMNIYSEGHYMIGVINNGIGCAYFSLKEYSKSLEYFNNALKISLASSGNESLTAAIYGGIAQVYMKQQKYIAAIDAGNNSLSLKQTIYDEKHPEIAKSCLLLANAYEKISKDEEALTLYNKALTILLLRYEDQKHPNLSECYLAIASIYMEKAFYEKASDYYQKGLKACPLFSLKDSLQYAEGLLGLAKFNIEIGRYNETESILKTAVSIQKKNITIADYYAPLNELATLYILQGKYFSADSILSSIESEFHASVDLDQGEYVTIIHSLGACYLAEGKYQNAEKYLNKALIISDSLNELDTLSHAQISDNLALLYMYWGKYNKAIHHSNESIEMIERTLGKDNTAYSTAINNLGLIYYFMGKYSLADTVLKECLEIEKNILGEHHPEYAKTLDNLGLVSECMGKYSEAEELYLKANKIFLEKFGKFNPDFAKSLDCLASLYQKLGRYNDAKDNYLSSLTIRKQVLGTEHPDYIISLSNLASLFKNGGYYIEAERMLKEIMKKQKEIFGENSEKYASTVNDLAMLYELMGKLTEAESLYLKAIQITKGLFSKNSEGYAALLYNIADLYNTTGKYNEAELFYKKALEIFKSIFGENHPNIAVVLNGLALHYYSSEQYVKAESIFLPLLKNISNQIETYFVSQSENEKNQFYNTIRLNFTIFNSFVKDRLSQNPLLCNELYNNQLQTKALLFNATKKIKERIKNSKNIILITKYNKWIEQKESLSKLYTLTQEQINIQGVNIDSLKRSANELEKELSIESAFLADVLDKKEYTWRDIQSKLKDGEAAIEIIRFEYYKKYWTDTVFYAALIITKETKGHPKYVLLENGNELENKDGLLKIYRDEISHESKMDSKLDLPIDFDADGKLYEAYWSLISKELPGIKKIYISPDGVYYQINLSILRNPDTKNYLSDEKEIIILTNTKDIVAEKPYKAGKNDIVLFGSPNYRLEADKQKIITLNILRHDKTDVELFPDTRDTLTRKHLGELPATKVEVENIAKIMYNVGWDTTVYQGDNAIVPVVKNVNSPRVLHIATHGGFLADREINKNKMEMRIMGIETKKYIENPLLRSMLFFAGAQRILSNTNTSQYKDIDNGILTAYDAMNLNLDKTELVVLSACETGLGEVKNGEGVYGMQRAFQTAGARYVLMSLWSVDSKATQQLMESFYRKWAASGDVRNAFREAQQELRKTYPHPYYWGAFVLIGS